MPGVATYLQHSTLWCVGMFQEPQRIRSFQFFSHRDVNVMVTRPASQQTFLAVQNVPTPTTKLRFVGVGGDTSTASIPFDFAFRYTQRRGSSRFFQPLL